MPYTINDAGEVSTNVRHCDSILDELSASELPLRVVELQHFPFDDSFRNFLRSKGGGIQELLFRGDGPLNSTHVAFIGGPALLLLRILPGIKLLITFDAYPSLVLPARSKSQFLIYFVQDSIVQPCRDST